MPEFEINLEDFLKIFISNTTFEQNLVNYIGQNILYLYSPIMVFNKIVCEGIRSTDSYKEVINALPKDFNKESVLDLKSNNGYVLLNIKKSRNAGRCDGIDTNANNNFIASSIVYYENLKNIAFNLLEISDAVKKIKAGEINLFDNILCFGLFEIKHKIEKDIIPDLVKCAKKRIIFEIINPQYDYKTEEEFIEYSKIFNKFGKVKTTILKYQNNPIIEIDVSENKEEFPITVEL